MAHWGAYLATFAGLLAVLLVIGVDGSLALALAVGAGLAVEYAVEIHWRRREHARDERIAGAG